ncbi:MAG: porin [Methylophilaceae bacterium]|nr:porin [Methyloradius sp.]
MMKFKLKTVTFALIASGVLLGNSFAVAATTEADDIQALRKTIEELDQKIKVIERKNEISAEESAAKKKETPVLKASQDGFGFKSADNNFEIKFKGLIQIDDRYYNDVNGLGVDGKNIDGFDFRRIRPTIDGTVFGKYDFRFTPEFGEAKTANATGTSGIVDAYIDARFQPWFKVRAGKFKPFVGLERLQSGSDIKFIERSYVSNNILPNRDLGAAIHGDILNSKLNYAFGIYNGVVDGGDNSTAQDTNQDKDYSARVFVTPFKDDYSVLSGLGFGLAATYGNFKGATGTTGSGLPNYKTAGQESNFFSYSAASFGKGDRTRISPQAYYYYNSFGLIAEYAQVNQGVSNGTRTDNLKNDAWQISGSYLLTGENASFKGVKPKNAFDTDTGGWGAWELVARYQENNIDSDAFSTSAAAAGTRYADPRINAKSAKSWAAGVNWYLNQNVKVVLNYETTSFDGGGQVTAAGAATGGFTNVADRHDERTLFTRLQLSY